MVNWPKIEYRHIFAYFISRPGTCMQEQLLSWKQLEAYNYFQNGYVRTVLCLVFDNGSTRYVLWRRRWIPAKGHLKMLTKYASLPVTSTNRTTTVHWHSYNDTSSPSRQVTTYCWCGGEDVGRMIACDNPNCCMEWFHIECVGITRKPKGKWFCSDSRREHIK